MKKVITYGSFDLFHEGHYNILQKAKALGDYLIVGVTTEHFDANRGKLNVMDTLLERIENVKKTGFVDEIIIEDHEGQKLEDIQKYGIDIFTLGSDWSGVFDYLKEYCEVVYLQRTPDISSTMLRASKFSIIRIGIVGTGRIAPRFMAEAKYVSGATLRAAYNPNQESGDKFAETNQIECDSGDFNEFLNKVDAVYIASPHETHYSYAKQALFAGKHVLCEKPLAFCRNEAIELYQIANDNRLVLMEGIKTAYCPGFAQMIGVAKSGVIGQICDVEACFSRITAPHLREMTDRQYGGAFLEFGSYTLLPIFKLLGLKYEKVEFDSILAENGIDLYTKIHFRYPGGMGMSKTGIGVKSEGQLIIAGTKGYILAESPWWLTKSFEVRYENVSRREQYSAKFLGDGLRYEISDFISRIYGKDFRSFKLTAEESIAMADIVERFMAERHRNRAERIRNWKKSGIGIWAHRGCSLQFPENTLPAFAEACKYDIIGIELDIQMTRDGKIVVIHDETVDRTTNGSGMVSDFTLSELKALVTHKNENSPYDSRSAAIPAIEEVFTFMKPLCEDRGLLINIEIKTGRVRYLGIEKKILQLVKDYKLEKYVIYSSFLAESLYEIKRYEPDARVAALCLISNEAAELSADLDLDALHLCYEKLGQHQKEIPSKSLRAWNCSETLFPERVNNFYLDLFVLNENGVSEIFTNTPEEYAECLDNRKL